MPDWQLIGSSRPWPTSSWRLTDGISHSTYPIPTSRQPVWGAPLPSEAPTLPGFTVHRLDRLTPNESAFAGTARADGQTVRIWLARGTARPSLWHRLGPRHVPLEAERCRHVAVAIPEVCVSRGIAVSPSQQSPQSQQPDVTQN